MHSVSRFIASTLLYSILHFAIILRGSMGQKTAIIVKRTKHNGPPIDTISQSFQKFVFASNVLVDRSLFIKEILEHHEKRLVIACPPKWSKTINLDMLKTFLQIETDNVGNRVLPINNTFAYKLFKYGHAFNGTKNESFTGPFLVSKHDEIIDKYLGRHPVVHLSFDYFYGQDYGEAIRSVKNILRLVYAEHRYLLEVLHEIYKNVNKTETVKRRKAKAAYHRFKNILEGTESDEDTITGSLDRLCKLLHHRYKKRVVVLVDDYDLPFYKLLYRKHFPECDIKRVLNYIEKIIQPILDEHNVLIERAVVTATYRTVDAFESTLKITPDYTMANNPWLEYFGSNEHEQQQLCQEAGGTDKQCRKISDWYLGFKANPNGGNMGQLFSTAIFLASNVTRARTCLIRKIRYDHITRLIKVKPFWEALESLINNNKLTINSNDLRFSVANMYHLKHLSVNNKLRSITHHTIDLTLSFLSASGYLAFGKSNVSAGLAQVWVPNMESTMEICRNLKSHYTQTYGIPFMLVDKLVGNIGVYATGTLEQIFEPQDLLLEELFRYVRPYNTSTSKISITEYYEDMMHALLSFVSMKLRSLMHLKTTIWKEPNPPASYMVGTMQNHGVVIAVQYNTTGGHLLELAKKQGGCLVNCGIRKFIAIALHADKTADMVTDPGNN